MKIRRAVALFLIIGVLGCSGDALKEKMQGTWSNEMMTVTINFDEKEYSGVALGKEFNKTIRSVELKENHIVFMADNTRITGRLLDDGRMELAKEGGVPMILEKKQ